MWKFIHKLASPPHFYSLAPKLVPWFTVPGLLLVAYGVYAGLFLAPTDYQQGDAFRIIYVHVPSAYLSMLAYMTMAISAAIGLIWRIKLSHAVAAAAAPLGAWFTFLEPTYVKTVPRNDGWRSPFRARSESRFYTLGSAARDKVFESALNAATYNGRTTTVMDCDIVYSNGSFMSYPEGIQTD